MKFICAFTLLFSLLLYVPQPWWWLELFTHFNVLLCLVSLMCFVFNVIKKQNLWITLTAVSSLLSVYPLYEFIPNAKPLTTHHLSIYNANELSTNPTPEKILKQIQSNQPDVITLQEFSKSLQKTLRPLNDQYPYKILVPQNNNFGIALYSKYPISNPQILKFEPLNLPSIEATITVSATQKIQIITTHPIPPLGQDMFEARNEHIENLSDQISKYSLPTIVTGDFNVTPYSYMFKQFIKTSGLKQARSGQGLLNSWPSKWAEFPFLSIPIDHILLSPAFTDFELIRLEDNGSDHRALLLNVNLDSLKIHQNTQKVVSPVMDR